MSYDSKKKRDHFGIMLVAALIIIRFCLVDRIPSYVIGSSPHDDAWVVIRAREILAGHWFGEYNQFTLIKGAFAPLLMACAKRLGITYMRMNTLLYILACVVFIKAMAPILKRTTSRVFCFAWLLFNPITFALETWQRVYRNGLSQWQLLLIFSGLTAIFLYREKPWHVLLKWVLLTGFSAWSLINSREDSIWIYPVVLCATLISVISFCTTHKEHRIRRTILLCVPLIIVIVGNTALSFINTAVYGASVRNDRVDGNYAKVARDLYLIEPDSADEARFSTEEYQGQYLNIYSSTMKKAFAVSPTLSSASGQIDKAIAGWDAGEDMVDGEPYLDHILFALRDGVAAAGHYTDLQETEQFYGKVHEELQAAFKAGSLEKRGLAFSAGAAPFEVKDIAPTMRELWANIRYTVSFSDVQCAAIPAFGSDDEIAMFEDIAGDRTLLKGDSFVRVSGWAFAYEDGKAIQVQLCSPEGEMLCVASFSDSQDVYDYFVQNGHAYDGAKAARFTANMTGYSLENGLLLRICDDVGNTLTERALVDIPQMQGIFEDQICYLIEKQEDSGQGIHVMEKYMADRDTARLNRIGDVYRGVGTPIFVLSLCAYVLICVLCVWMRKRSDCAAMNAAWLLETGVLLSYVLFAACLAYMTATTFYARIYLYLSPMYVMELMFSGVALPFAFEALLDTFWKKREGRDNG